MLDLFHQTLRNKKRQTTAVAMSTQQPFITELLGSQRNCALIDFYTQYKMPTHTHDTKNQYLNYTQRLKWYYLLRIV